MKRPARIALSRDGPILVTLDCVTNSKGERIDASIGIALCRCGASAEKPICDGSHISIGFSDARDPNSTPYVAKHPGDATGDAGLPSIYIAHNGPYEVQGLALDTDAWGEGVPRDRFKLCRCGGSKSKPFCDGTHRRIGFVDERN